MSNNYYPTHSALHISTAEIVHTDYFKEAGLFKMFASFSHDVITQKNEVNFSIKLGEEYAKCSFEDYQSAKQYYDLCLDTRQLYPLELYMKNTCEIQN